MPMLSEVTYSQDDCIAAIRDFYHFLTKMYLKESVVAEPPVGGWPTITAENLQSLGKSDKVISLLRHLPYLIEPDYRFIPEVVPLTQFADWKTITSYINLDQEKGEAYQMTTQGYGRGVPPHTVGLTHGGRDIEIFLLDTELGIAFWVECPGRIRWNPPCEPVLDDLEEYYPAESDTEWITDAVAWAIPDFFKVLEEQFRQLHFVPMNSWTVWNASDIPPPGLDLVIPVVQNIYREHGWPNLEHYRKRECLEALQKMMEEHFPDDADMRRPE